jgi:hypothetical protein
MVLPGESFYQIVPYDAVARSGGARFEAPSASAEQHVDGAAAAVSGIR